MSTQVQTMTGAPRAAAGREKAGVKVLVPLGRVLFAVPFLLTIYTHFQSSMVEYARAAGVPLPSLLVPLTGLMAFAGGLSVALGYRAKLGAWLLVAFLLPVTLVMHNFWAFTDPSVAQVQMAHFTKNFALLGASLVIAHHGSGPYSVDRREET